MYYSSKDSVKDELKWKKALQRRLLDSGHNDSSLRVLGIIALFFIILICVFAAVNYTGNTSVLNSVMGINDIASANSNSIAVVQNPLRKVEIIITAEEEERITKSDEQDSEQKVTAALPVIDQKQIQNEDNEVQVAFQKAATSAPIVLFSKSFCPFCTEIKKILLPYNRKGDGEIVVNVIELDRDPNGRLLLDGIEQIVGRRSVPQTFVSGDYYGGLRAVKDAEESGKLGKLIDDARLAFKISQTASE